MTYDLQAFATFAKDIVEPKNEAGVFDTEAPVMHIEPFLAFHVITSVRYSHKKAVHLHFHISSAFHPFEFNESNI
jgi:hypothetical protein